MGRFITKTALICLAAAAIVATGIIIAGKSVKGSPGRGLNIEKTANVVEKISAISKYTSACYYEELVVTRSKTNSHVDNAVGNKLADVLPFSKGIITDELCVIARGTVRAGYDFSLVGEDSVRVSGDTLFVRMPFATVLDIQLNPSDCEIYVCDGKWTDNELASVQREARNKLYSNALDSGILKTAKESGERQIKSLFNSFGFKTVVLE